MQHDPGAMTVETSNGNVGPAHNNQAVADK